MVIKKAHIIYCLALMLLAISSCKTVTRLSHRNFDYLYDETRFFLEPDYHLFHHSTDSSTLYFRISSNALKYTRESEEEPYKAKYKIRYERFNSYRDNVVADSLTVFFSDTDRYNTGLALTDSIILPLPAGNNYLLKVEMTDMLGSSQSISLIESNKSEYNIQFFKVFRQNAYDEKTLLYSPFLEGGGNYILQYWSLVSKKAHVEVYYKPQPVAMPPFADRSQSIYEVKPDSVFQLDINNGVANLFIDCKGIYRVKVDDSDDSGALLYCFYEGFPNVEGDKRLYPLRYITSGEEFQTLTAHPDPTDAVDIFWTAMAGTHLRGNVTIERYYDNVQKANKYFTTWKEGWKTDRGMIYTVFGPPGHVSIDANYERWTYDGSWQIPQTEFRFRRVNAPLGTICFELERRPEYRNTWFYLIDNLRR